MKRPGINRLTVVVLMIALFVLGVFLPALNTANNNDHAKNKVIVKTLNGKVPDAQNPIPSLINLFEEEEVETTLEMDNIFAINLLVYRVISFSSPSLFFTEHFTEVSGPPPWL